MRRIKSGPVAAHEQPTSPLLSGPKELINTTKLVDPWTDDSCRDFLVAQTITHLFFYHEFMRRRTLDSSGATDEFQNQMALVLDLQGLVARVKHLPSLPLSYGATRDSPQDSVSCQCCSDSCSNSPNDNQTAGNLTSCTLINFFTAITGSFPAQAGTSQAGHTSGAVLSSHGKDATQCEVNPVNHSCPYHNPTLRNTIPSIVGPIVSRKSGTPSVTGGHATPTAGAIATTPSAHATASVSKSVTVTRPKEIIAPRALRFGDEEGDDSQIMDPRSPSNHQEGKKEEPMRDEALPQEEDDNAKSSLSTFPSRLSFCCPGCIADLAAHYQNLLVRSIVMERWGVRDMQFMCWLLGRGAAVVPAVGGASQSQSVGGASPSLANTAATPFKSPSVEETQTMLETGTPMKAPEGGVPEGTPQPSSATPLPLNDHSPSVRDEGEGQTPHFRKQHTPNTATKGQTSAAASPAGVPPFPYQVPPARREALANILKSLYYDTLKNNKESIYTHSSNKGGVDVPTSRKESVKACPISVLRELLSEAVARVNHSMKSSDANEAEALVKDEPQVPLQGTTAALLAGKRSMSSLGSKRARAPISASTEESLLMAAEPEDSEMAKAMLPPDPVIKVAVVGEGKTRSARRQDAASTLSAAPDETAQTPSTDSTAGAKLAAPAATPLSSRAARHQHLDRFTASNAAASPPHKKVEDAPSNSDGASPSPSTNVGLSGIAKTKKPKPKYVKVPCLEQSRVWMSEATDLPAKRAHWREVQRVACDQLMQRIEAHDDSIPTSINGLGDAVPRRESVSSAASKVVGGQVVDIDAFGRLALKAFRDLVAEEEEEDSAPRLGWMRVGCTRATGSYNYLDSCPTGDPL